MRRGTRSVVRRSGLVRAVREPLEAEPVLERDVPGWTLHVACALVVAVTLLVAWSTAAPVAPVPVLACVVGGVLVAALPSGLRVLLAVGVVGGCVLVGGGASVAATLALVLLVHLAVFACATTTRVTWRMRVELAVVLDGLAGVARVQVPAQVLAVVALVVAGRDVSGDVWRVASLVGAALVAALVLPRSRD